jgi:hypothetical protein
MREGEIREASEAWIGEVVRMTWQNGDWNGDVKRSRCFSPEVGLVVGLMTEYRIIGPDIRNRDPNRLLVWWPENNSFKKHPSWELWPIGKEVEL